MNYSNNLYKRYITQLFSNNPKKTISISRTTQNILLDKMSLNSNTKFFIKNKNKKNLFVSQQSQRIIKNLSIDSFAETKKIRLNKTIEIKNLKINKDKKFPKITQYERNFNNFENNNNIPKLLSKSKTTKKEKSIENISKSPMYYYRLLQIYKIKEILDYKKKKNEEFLKQLVVKNSVKKKNKFILNGKEKGKKIGKIKLINIRIKNEEKDSEEDIDKVEQNYYNLIKKGNERIQVSNFDDDNKIMNVNNSLNKKNLAQKEKNYSENSKIFNYKNILFHNPILINNLNI